jgi:hypothetical protein
VNPIDDLRAVLPAAPLGQELPGRGRHRDDLLAIVAAEPAGDRSRPGWLPGLRRPGSQRSLLAVSAAAAVVVVAVLAVLIPSLLTSSTRPGPRPGGGTTGTALTSPRHWSVASAGLDAVTTVTTSGPVTVTGSATSSVAITATPHYQGRAPVLTSRVAGRTLTVTATCPQEPHCQVALTVVLPARLAARAQAQQGNITARRLSGPVTATTQQGDIDLTGVSGPVTATTDQGDISLTGVSGPVTARTSQGQISGDGLAAKTATVSTEQGDIDLAFVVPPQSVTAITQQGSVDIRLPAAVAYRVSASTQLGSRSVTVPQSALATHAVTARTEVGSVTVSG